MLCAVYILELEKYSLSGDGQSDIIKRMNLLLLLWNAYSETIIRNRSHLLLAGGGGGTAALAA